MNASSDPRHVAPTEDGSRLRIEWADGHASEYAPRYLRLQCRCAVCVDELTGAPLLDPRAVPEDVYPLAIRYVGRYALGFDWSDGHDTGIYPFEMLRAVCPCDACTGAAERGSPG
ncbi:MAG TPA: DUF971 domain-containing protein [Longimicrobiales bacterium]